MDELLDVLTRPRLVKKYLLEAPEIARYVALLIERAEMIAVHGAVKLCRDHRDNAILETAIGGQASCLVSRDDDIKRDEELVTAMRREGVHVHSVASFLATLTEETSGKS